MRSPKAILFLLPSLLLIAGCCCPPPCWSTVDLCTRHIEQPFQLPTGGPGVGLVFGTADFSSSGGVLVKVQVEKPSDITTENATITAWSGNDEWPSAEPTGGIQLFATGGDVPLRFWTTHIARDADDDQNTDYWVFVKVDYRLDPSDSREVHYYRKKWDGTVLADPDQPHKFFEFTPP
jgi:hypothetical protein